jgi:hypothetical protein
LRGEPILTLRHRYKLGRWNGYTNVEWLVGPKLGGARFDHQHQRLAAVTRGEKVDVFVLGCDDRLWNAYWDGSGS